MPNMLDYIAWRGDLTLLQDPLNENDELVLSQLAYVAFGGYIPGPDRPGESVTLEEAVSWLVAHDPDGEKIHQTGFMWEDNKKLLRALRGSRRFGGMRLFNYVDSISTVDEKQFAAMTIDIGDGTVMVAYRGTDDTLIGWKEDLNMALDTPVPAQLQAVEYLEGVVAGCQGRIRVVGHSKGGNLSVYATSHCSDAAFGRLLRVVSHDGPGQSSATIHSEGFARIQGMLDVYIPHFSIVGMLLEHGDKYTVVQSDASDILQHSAFSWQMQGTKMRYAESPSERSLHTNQVLRDWIATLTPENKELFIEAVYEVATTTYGDTLPEDVEHSWPLNIQTIFAAVLRLEPKTRSMFTKGLSDLFSTAIKNIRFPWQREEAVEKLEEAAEAQQIGETTGE